MPTTVGDHLAKSQVHVTPYIVAWNSDLIESYAYLVTVWTIAFEQYPCTQLLMDKQNNGVSNTPRFLKLMAVGTSLPFCVHVVTFCLHFFQIQPPNVCRLP